MNPQRVEKVEDGSTIIDYAKIRPYHNVKCGVEYRDIDVPDDLKRQQPSPQCCFSLLLDNEQAKVILCSQTQNRCVQESRMIMKRVKADCIRLMGENGLATQQEVEDYMEKMDFSGDPNIVVEQEHSVDPWLNVQFLEGIWQGKIKYIKLNKKKNQVPTQTGYFSLNKREIMLAESPALAEVGQARRNNIFDLFFLCLTTGPCHPDSYVQAYKKNNNVYDAMAIDK